MSFLLFGLTSHSSHSLSSYVRFLKVSDIFMFFPELTPLCPYLLYWKPRMDTELQMFYQCWAGGRAHLPQPAVYTLCHSAWKAVDLLCCEYWLLASIQFGVHEDSLVPLCTAAVRLLAGITLLRVVSHQE